VSVVETEFAAISLELGDDLDICREFAGPLYVQLSRGGYDLCSTLPLPASVEEWRAGHRTARKRADRAERMGYRFVPVRRHKRAAELFVINTSLHARQHRPMSESYMRHPSETPDPEYPCARHGVHPYGIESADSTLVAYLWLYRAGELCLVSQILGHGGFLDDGIMYLLWQGMLGAELGEPGIVVYNRHDSGTDGLRFYKERVGLSETSVRWSV
jgi:hypothetical protein